MGPLTLTADRYWETVLDDESLDEKTTAWSRRLQQWGDQNGYHTGDRYGLLVNAARWSGESYEIRVLADDSLDYVWVVPPEPPPAELIRHAEPGADA